MIAEAEVIVAGEVDDLLAIVSADGALLVVEHAQLEEGSALPEVAELGGEVGKLETRGGSGGHRDNRKPFVRGQYCAAKTHLRNCGMYLVLERQEWGSNDD